MTSEISSDSNTSKADDSFWTALLQQQEEVITPTPYPNESKEIWTSINSPVNGRFSWANGKEKPNPWQLAQEYHDNDDSLTLTVKGYNKGGLLVQWHTLQGFIPASQLIDFPQFHLETERMRALKKWVDKPLTLKIIEVNKEVNRLILSERAALVEADERDDLLYRINEGDQLDGQVTNLTKFGAFVDLGGVEGLIHISELSWSRVIHPSDIVQPGKKVTVSVLSIDPNNGRIALSLKQLKKDPWATVDTRYKVGQLVEGVVNNVVKFGAFVMVEDELEGLVHISELAEGNFLHPHNVVHKGQKVVARILTVHGASKRLALSLRGIEQNRHQK